MDSASPGEITDLLRRLKGPNNQVIAELLPLVYNELRELARAQLSRERPEHTLSPTDLVHEAYVKLVDQRRTDWKNRAHFFAIAATAMRRILIDHARARQALKRGGDAIVITYGEEAGGGRERSPDELIDVDTALRRLTELDERQARVVECRFFVGLSDREIAEALGVSVPTVRRDWRSARAWLHRELRAGRASTTWESPEEPAG